MRHSFWLSLLLHFLFLLSISTAFLLAPNEPQKHPNYYVPAYVAQASKAPMPQTAPMDNSNLNSPKQERVNDKPEPEKKVADTQDQTPDKPLKTAKNGLLKKSMLAASQAVLQETQRKAITAKRESEPIYLVGDSNEEADPLTKLVGRALSAHFEYPRSAGQFGIHGITVVEFTLHPEGYFTDVRVSRSSNSDDLDAAALYAVNAAPEVKGASRFISEPKHMVIGFIFRLVSAYN